MDLTLARFQQIVSSIKVRQYISSREESARFSWLGRAISTFVAAGYMTDGDNPAIEKAGHLSIDDVEAALLGVRDAAEDWKPGDDAILAKTPQAGSFEKLIQTMSQTR